MALAFVVVRRGSLDRKKRREEHRGGDNERGASRVGRVERERAREAFGSRPERSAVRGSRVRGVRAKQAARLAREQRIEQFKAPRDARAPKAVAAVAHGAPARRRGRRANRGDHERVRFFVARRLHGRARAFPKKRLAIGSSSNGVVFVFVFVSRRERRPGVRPLADPPGQLYERLSEALARPLRAVRKRVREVPHDAGRERGLRGVARAGDGPGRGDVDGGDVRGVRVVLDADVDQTESRTGRERVGGSARLEPLHAGENDNVHGRVRVRQRHGVEARVGSDRRLFFLARAPTFLNARDVRERLVERAPERRRAHDDRLARRGFANELCADQIRHGGG